jgi:hypothetical protein
MVIGGGVYFQVPGVQSNPPNPASIPSRKPVLADRWHARCLTGSRKRGSVKGKSERDRCTYYK